jgi:hypothetical protein
MFDGYCRLKPAERNALDQLLGEQRAWLDENTRFGAPHVRLFALCRDTRPGEAPRPASTLPPQTGWRLNCCTRIEEKLGVILVNGERFGILAPADYQRIIDLADIPRQRRPGMRGAYGALARVELRYARRDT